MSKRKASDEPPAPPLKNIQQSHVQTLRYPSTLSPSHTNPVPFQQPVPLLTFSYNSDKELEFNDTAMRYYVGPPPGAELGHGYDQWVRKPDGRGRINNLLRAWVRARKTHNQIPQIGVVSWRGVMTKILTAPYEERDGWDLNVMSVNGTLYLEEHLSDAKLREKNDMTPRQRLQTYYGYAFESWCTSSKPRHDRPKGSSTHPGWGGDVDTNVQWCNVVRTKLGDTRIVLGGEVDCIRETHPGEHRGEDFVELKTSLAIRRPQDEARFEKKLLKFYFQSFLLGVPEIVVGFRSPAGKLTTTQSFKTTQIPRLVRSKPGAWDPQLCLNWGQRFLAFLKDEIAAHVPLKRNNKESSVDVWRVKFAPREGVTILLLDEEEVEDVRGGEDRVGFLPRWFWESEVVDKEAVEPTEQSTATTQSETIPLTELPPPHTRLPPGWQI